MWDEVSCTKLQLPPQPVTKGLPPPDPRSLCWTPLPPQIKFLATPLVLLGPFSVSPSCVCVCVFACVRECACFVRNEKCCRRRYWSSCVQCFAVLKWVNRTSDCCYRVRSGCRKPQWHSTGSAALYPSKLRGHNQASSRRVRLPSLKNRLPPRLYIYHQLTYLLIYLLPCLLAYPRTYLLTYSLEQSPSWEANWSAASQETPLISRNPKVHYRTHKCPPPVSILGQIDPVHVPTSHFLKIHLNIILPSTSGSPKMSFPLRFPHQTPVFTPLFPIRATYPAHILDFITRTILGKDYRSLSS